jgi:diguanylate cyclase (GGDEF)-like protein
MDARVIAKGDLTRKVEAEGPDEIGDLGESINIITRRIRDNMEELRSYGERTRKINMEIHKKVIALSNILQIGDLMSGASELSEILELALEKLSQIYETGYSLIYVWNGKTEDFRLKSVYSLPESLGGLKTESIKAGEGDLGQILTQGQARVIDSSTENTEDTLRLKNETGVKNCIFVPIMSGKRVRGLLITGNHLSNFRYGADDIELIKVFSRQIFIAIENDILLKKAEEMSIKDDLTGLYNLNFIKECLEDEIKRAIMFQRPCSFVVFNIDNFDKYRNENGEMPTERVLKKVARTIRENATQIGKSARLGGDEFAVLLPEKNKKEATLIAERIRRKAEELLLNDTAEGRGLTVSGGVSENPLDGATVGELMDKAKDALSTAKSQGKNRIVA